MRRYGNEFDVEADVKLSVKDLLKIVDDLSEENKEGLKTYLSTGEFSGNRKEIIYDELHDATAEVDFSSSDIIDYIKDCSQWDKNDIFQECYADDLDNYDISPSENKVLVEFPNLIARKEFEDFYESYCEKWNLNKY